jgi:hypothetical protein
MGRILAGIVSGTVGLVVFIFGYLYSAHLGLEAPLSSPAQWPWGRTG